MKALSYLRFSTPEQKLGNSTERQLKAARDYCSRNGLELDEGLSIADEGLSAYKGHNIERGSLGHFLAEVKTGKIPTGTALIVEKIDRLSRQGVDETTDILKDLTRNGIEVHVIGAGGGAGGQVLKLGFNSNITDYIMIGLQAHLAYQESLNKSERVLSAWDAKMKAAVASGTPLGKRLPVWLAIEGQKRAGSKIIDHGKIVTLPEKVAVVQEIFELAAAGVGSAKISERLNGRVLTRGWIVRTLRNRSVLGEFQIRENSGEVIPDYFPQIISQSLFEAARAQIDAKQRGGKYIGGNRQHSDTADNLFTGLLFDITSEPVRSLYFQRASKNFYYVMSAPHKDGRPCNRLRYDKLEPAILDFLSKQDWNAIAGETESDEYKAAKVALEATLRQLDICSREIASNTSAMEGEPIEVRKVLARQVAKDEAVMVTLTEQRDALQGNVEAAQAKCGALSKPVDLLNLMNQSDRMKLRTEIQKRVSRIDLIFLPDRQGFLAIAVFSNGACRGLTSIRAGIAQIELHFDESDYETMKEQMLDLARRYSVPSPV